MIHYYHDIDQGSEEWHALRCGILTASEIKLIMTPTLKPARNDKDRAQLYELLAQRITGHTEPSYISDDMLRGYEDEINARILYSEHFAPVKECGFITNDDHGFVLGYSPDGLVGDEGLIECKSRRQKFQMQTILADAVPEEYVLQCQAGLLISGRKWLDFISYCGGMPMFVKRVFPDDAIQNAIVDAATQFEDRIEVANMDYCKWMREQRPLIKTARNIEQEITL